MYNTIYNPQLNLDRINSQIAELEKMKSQIQQPIQPPTNLTQNFQLAPVNREAIRYANSLDEVQKDMVISDTPYFSKDLSVVWIKNTKGEIKTYELTEIIPKDEKDVQIELLQTQIEQLRKEMRRYDANIANVDATKDTTDTDWSDESTRESIEENKPSSIQRVSTSKKKQSGS